MEGLNFLVVGLVQLALAVYGALNLRRRFNVYALMVVVVVFGLAYDNLSVAVGALIPPGELLRALNVPRYWIHAITTPSMIISAFGVLRLTGSKFGQSRLWHTLVCLVATALIALGSYINIFNLSLSPVTENGVTRYLNTFVLIKGPPIPPVATIILVIIFGVALWKNTKYPWLALGAVAELVAGLAQDFLLVQNIGEIAFAAGLIFTLIFAARYQPEPAGSGPSKNPGAAAGGA
jgi:hypothetical protein